MYTPASNVPDAEVEIVCISTGESYVYVDGDDTSTMDPKLAQGAIDMLPVRFYRYPWAVKLPNNQVRIIFPKMT